MRIHIVQKGDTLWKIAKEYGISFEDLKRLNVHLANPDYIVPGMEIILPEKINKEPHKEMPKKESQMHKETPKEVPKKRYRDQCHRHHQLYHLLQCQCLSHK